MRQHSPPFTSPAPFHRSIANTLSVLIPMIGPIHAPIGKAACCALFAAANRLLNHQHDARVRRLPALLLWACPWCRSESGAVSGLGVRCRNFWPGQYHPGSGARLPPPRRRRPPVPFLPRCSPLCRSSEPRSSHVTKKNFYVLVLAVVQPVAHQPEGVSVICRQI